MGRSDLREGVSEIHRDEAREVCIVGGGKKGAKEENVLCTQAHMFL